MDLLFSLGTLAEVEAGGVAVLGVEHQRRGACRRAVAQRAHQLPAVCFSQDVDRNRAERLVFNAYRRAIQGFESFDTTVLMGS